MFYMVSPTGKIYDIQYSHNRWAHENYSLIGMSPEEEARIFHDGMTSLVDMFVKDGWIRVHMRSTDLGFEVKDFSNSTFNRIRKIIDRTPESSSYGDTVNISLVDSLDYRTFPIGRFMYVTANNSNLSMR